MQTVANNLIAQIGTGTFAMLGAASLVALENGVQFSIKGSPVKANKLVITLAADDTYTVQAWKIKKFDCNLLAEMEMVHADSLHATIETLTKLRTRI
jgi:hypothetical protein